jgi:hypothetical protein
LPRAQRVLPQVDHCTTLKFHPASQPVNPDIARQCSRFNRAATGTGGCQVRSELREHWMIDEARLANYLQDHYAASSAGIELFKRAADQQSDAVARTALTRIIEQVDDERVALERYLAAVGAKPDPVKNAGAWVAEKLGRFKPNGELIRRSPLSDVVELEVLRVAVEGKAAGWRVLRKLAETEDRFKADELEALLKIAAAQIEELEELRMSAADRAFHI